VRDRVSSKPMKISNVQEIHNNILIQDYAINGIHFTQLLSRKSSHLIIFSELIFDTLNVCHMCWQSYCRHFHVLNAPWVSHWYMCRIMGSVLLVRQRWRWPDNSRWSCTDNDFAWHRCPTLRHRNHGPPSRYWRSDFVLSYCFCWLFNKPYHIACQSHLCFVETKHVTNV